MSEIEFHWMLSWMVQVAFHVVFGTGLVLCSLSTIYVCMWASSHLLDWTTRYWELHAAFLDFAWNRRLIKQWMQENPKRCNFQREAKEANDQ